MDAFETTAILEDASHLVLHDPVPQPAAKKCRVILLFEKTDVAKQVKSGGRDAHFAWQRLPNRWAIFQTKKSIAPSTVSEFFNARERIKPRRARSHQRRHNPRVILSKATGA